MSKTRVVLGDSYRSQNLLWGTPQPDGRTYQTVKEAQVVSSFNNPYRDLGKGRDVGGPFFSQKLEVTAIPDPMWVRGYAYQNYIRLYPSSEAQSACSSVLGGSSDAYIQTKLAALCPAPIPANQLDSRGATAISRVAPTNPVFDGATALAELFSERKLFSVPGKSGSLSGEYLNYQLGVSPAIGAYSDLRSTMAKSETILAQLHRDSGKVVRRRYYFPSVSVSSVVQAGNVYPAYDLPGPTTYQVGKGTMSKQTTTTTDMWFSGAFTYHLPKEMTFARKVAELDKLYGVKPGVDTVWELIPYSFVADYFSNAGDVIKNINAFSSDGLVMVYGYLMAKTVKETVYRWTGQVRDWNWFTYTCIASVKTTTMQRQQANPFGFGVLTDDLSPRQLSILAALGLNRR